MALQHNSTSPGPCTMVGNALFMQWPLTLQASWRSVNAPLKNGNITLWLLGPSLVGLNKEDTQIFKCLRRGLTTPRLCASARGQEQLYGDGEQTGRRACCHYIGGPSPSKLGTTFPLPGSPKSQQPPGFELVTHLALIVVVSHGGVNQRTLHSSAPLESLCQEARSSPQQQTSRAPAGGPSIGGVARKCHQKYECLPPCMEVPAH